MFCLGMSLSNESWRLRAPWWRQLRTWTFGALLCTAHWKGRGEEEEEEEFCFSLFFFFFFLLNKVTTDLDSSSSFRVEKWPIDYSLNHLHFISFQRCACVCFRRRDEDEDEEEEWWMRCAGDRMVIAFLGDWRKGERDTRSAMRCDARRHTENILGKIPQSRHCYHHQLCASLSLFCPVMIIPRASKERARERELSSSSSTCCQHSTGSIYCW